MYLFLLSMGFEPADWTITISDCIGGNCNAGVLLGLLPLIPSKAGGYAGDIAKLLPASARKNFPWHHLFPQALEKMFARLGIKIDVHLVSLPIDVHKQIHKGAAGGLWNKAWKSFFEDNPNATAEDVFKYVGELIHEFGLDGLIQLVQ